LEQGVQEGVEVLLLYQGSALTIQHGLMVAKITMQSSHKLAAENTAEQFDGRKNT
jgi:hypothetical protein